MGTMGFVSLLLLAFFIHLRCFALLCSAYPENVLRISLPLSLFKSLLLSDMRLEAILELSTSISIVSLRNLDCDFIWRRAIHIIHSNKVVTTSLE